MDVIQEILSELLNEYWITDIDPKEFESVLAVYGFMIVPIEDPTNLRFGVED